MIWYLFSLLEWTNIHEKLTKKNKIIIVSSVVGISVVGVTLGICITLILSRINNSVEAASTINFEKKEFKTLKILNYDLNKSTFSDLRNYFVHKYTGLLYLN